MIKSNKKSRRGCTRNKGENDMVTRCIAVVEDNEDSFERLHENLDRFAEEENMTLKIDRFASALDFLARPTNSYAVVFMDVRLPDIDGMTASKKLRETNKAISVIFVTSLAQYARFGYEVDAVGYMIKPVEYYAFSLVFKKALKLYQSREETDMLFELPGGKYKISIDKLMYVEIIAHRLYFHLVDDVIEMTGTLSDIEKRLKGHGFARCNSCYLVNMRHIKSVRGLDVEIGIDVLHISRAKRKSFIEELSAWYIERGNTSRE